MQKCYPKFAKTQKLRQPKLTPLTSEELVNRTANTTNVARLDITAREVWDRGQYAYLDLRVFDLSACLYLTSCSMNEQEKKRAYNKSVFQIEYVTFISLFFFDLWKYGEGMRYVLFKIIRFII